MSSIPKASINDLINVHNTSASPTAPASNPISDFVSMLAKHAQSAMQTIQNNPQVKQTEQQMADSPIGQAVQGKFNNVLPAMGKTVDRLGKGFQDFATGKTDSPPINFTGEMQEVPGEGLPPIGEKPASDPFNGVKPPGKTITRIKLPASVYGAAREAQVQNTVDHYVPGSTAEEQYKNLQPTMDSFGKQIQAVMKSQPKQASIDTIMTNYDKNLNEQGIYRTTNTPKNVIQKAAQSYVRDLYNTASGASNEVVPTNISDQDLYGFKQSINQDAKSAYKKIENGTTLTDKDRVILAAQKTIDDSLTQLHPEVKDLTVKQSHLYDAADSLESGRAAERKAAANAPSFGQKVGGLFKNPLVDVGLGAAGATGLGSLPSALGAGATLLRTGIENLTNGSKNQSQNNSTKNEGIHQGSISNYLNNVKADSQGHVALPEPSAPVTPLTPGTPEYVRAKNSLPNDTSTFMSNAKTLYVPATNKLVDDLNTMPLDIWHGMKSEQDIQNYMSNPKSPYAKQVSDLNSFNAMFQGAYKRVTGSAADPSQLITPGLLPEQLKQRFAGMVQFIHDTYSQFYTPYAQTSEVVGNTANGGIQQYQQAPQNNNASSMIQSPLTPLPGSGGLPPIGAMPAQ